LFLNRAWEFQLQPAKYKDYDFSDGAASFSRSEHSHEPSGSRKSGTQPQAGHWTCRRHCPTQSCRWCLAGLEEFPQHTDLTVKFVQPRRAVPTTIPTNFFVTDEPAKIKPRSIHPMNGRPHGAYLWKAGSSRPTARTGSAAPFASPTDRSIADSWMPCDAVCGFRGR
jgi:hypothetical protein